jgi:hypothetical protein
VIELCDGLAHKSSSLWACSLIVAKDSYLPKLYLFGAAGASSNSGGIDVRSLFGGGAYFGVAEGAGVGECGWGFSGFGVAGAAGAVDVAPCVGGSGGGGGDGWDCDVGGEDWRSIGGGLWVAGFGGADRVGGVSGGDGLAIDRAGRSGDCLVAGGIGCDRAGFVHS